MKIVTAAQMKRIDTECINSGTPASVLMENAGRSVAEEIARISGSIAGKKVVVLAGPGNNGGDGLVAARYLHDWKAEVCLFVFGKKREQDPNLELVKLRNITCTEEFAEKDIEGLKEAVTEADIMVDALFGTGNNRPLEGIYKQALQAVQTVLGNNPGIHTFAVDLPSGLNADTGVPDEACLAVDDTITLACPKVGLYVLPGAEKAGKITIVDIGIPKTLFKDINLELNTVERIGARLPKRHSAGNKGTFGRVMVVAGSVNYVGAAYLACSGAVRSGAGLVTLATASSLHPILASRLVEVTHLPLPEAEPGIISPGAVMVLVEELKKYNVLLIGCGLGQSLTVKDFIRTLLLEYNIELPFTVVDADALNTLADTPEWWRGFTGNAILTPHPGEMSRLTGKDIGDIQADRLRTAEEYAEKWDRTVVLKGAYSVIASPGENSVINPVANPGLASAGTGDVLAGIIAGLAAQGLNAADAASCGVCLHTAAGELVKEKLGDTGMTASDLLPVIPVAIKNIKNIVQIKR